MGCRFGTLSPSLCQIRPTRFTVTLHPSAHRSAAIRREPVPAILGGQRDDRRRQGIFVGPRRRLVPLGGPVLPQDATGSPFGHPEPLTERGDARAPAGGAQQAPVAASFRVSLSRVRSAAIFRRWPFSRSNSFRRLTWAVNIPPNS